LSRNDAFFGDSLSFNPTIWDRTLTHFPNDTISFAQSAAARLERLVFASSVNPNFNLTGGLRTLSFAESGLYQLVFGDRQNGNANKLFVKTIFGMSLTLMISCVRIPLG
jgi:hypothetical protein